MREYARVQPTFWTGETGRALRQNREAQVLALYLMTCPSSNMLGLYYLPIPIICHETGLSKQGALKGLQSPSEGGFCHYDAPSEHVFVVEMAAFQLGPRLSASDNKVKGIKKELEKYRTCCFFNAFLDCYTDAYHLEDVARSEAPSKLLQAPPKPLPSPPKPSRSPSEAPPKQLTGAGTGAGEQEQEQEQE